MLVISRRIGEEIVIGENVRLVVSAIAGNRVKLSIDAPESIRILRSEREQTQECLPLVPDWRHQYPHELQF